MTKIIIDLDDPKLHDAARQISAAILAQFPDAQLRISENLDPPRLYVVAEVDIDDTEPVMDSFIDLLIDFQVEDRLPLDVIIRQTPERQKADLDLALARNRRPPPNTEAARTFMADFRDLSLARDSGGLLALLSPVLEDPRIREAVEELTATILDQYPDSKITAEIGDDPLGIYLTAIVDLDDPDEVLDIVVDRVVDLNVWEGIPIHVIPLRTDERERKMREEQEAARAAGLPPAPLYD